MAFKIFTNGTKPIALIVGDEDDSVLASDVRDVARYCRRQAQKRLKKQRNHWLKSTPKMLHNYASTMIDTFYRPLLNLYTNSLRPAEQQLPIKSSDFINFYQRYLDGRKLYQVNLDIHDRLENNPSYKILNYYSIDYTQEGLDDVTHQSIQILAKGYPKHLLSNTDVEIMQNDARFCYAIEQLVAEKKLQKYIEQIYEIEIKRCQNYSIGYIISENIENFAYLITHNANHEWDFLSLNNPIEYQNTVVDTNELTDSKQLVSKKLPPAIKAKRDLNYPTRQQIKDEEGY